MKKVKIMLLSLALFAVVGAALAFKAKFQIDYCTSDADPNGSKPNTCPSFFADKTTINAQVFYWTTTPRDAGGGVLVCTDAQGDPLPCDVTTSLKND